MRTRVKLAGIKDIAKTMQMETSTSTEEAILGAGVHELFRAELCMPQGWSLVWEMAHAIWG